MAAKIHPQTPVRPADRDAWLSRRHRAGLPVPLVRREENTQKADTLTAALGDVFAAPQLIHLKRLGVDARVDEPTMAGLTEFLTLVAAKYGKHVGEDVAGLLSDLGPEARGLLVTCVQVKGPSGWEDVTDEWFQRLKVTDGLLVVETFVGMVDFEAMKARWVSLSGKVMGARGRAVARPSAP